MRCPQCVSQAIRSVALSRVFAVLDGFPFVRITDSSSTKALSFSSARTIKRCPSSRCASAIQIVRSRESMVATQPPTPTGFAEKADHRAVHFEIKAAAANVVSSGHSSGQDLPQETQMNVRRLLIVKKRESGYESVELNRRAPAATDLPRAAAVCS